MITRIIAMCCGIGDSDSYSDNNRRVDVSEVFTCNNEREGVVSLSSHNNQSDGSVSLSFYDNQSSDSVSLSSYDNQSIVGGGNYDLVSSTDVVAEYCGEVSYPHKSHDVSDFCSQIWRDDSVFGRMGLVKAQQFRCAKKRTIVKGDDGREYVYSPVLKPMKTGQGTCCSARVVTNMDDFISKGLIKVTQPQTGNYSQELSAVATVCTGSDYCLVEVSGDNNCQSPSDNFPMCQEGEYSCIGDLVGSSSKSVSHDYDDASRNDEIKNGCFSCFR